MVLIPMPDGTPYCIDSRQGTYGEYDRFIRENGQRFDLQPPECNWNRRFASSGNYKPGLFGVPESCSSRELGKTTQPVQCISFCAAWAFCSWAGKRLCGMRDSDPGKVMVVDATDAATKNRIKSELRSTKNEWFNACSQRGCTAYPYGNTLDKKKCDDSWLPTVPGGGVEGYRDSLRNECHGTHPPFDQVYDMVGGIPTWLNICFPGNRCVRQGGTKDHRSSSCDGTYTLAGPLDNLSGVRCCADAVPGVPDNR